MKTNKILLVVWMMFLVTCKGATSTGPETVIDDSLNTDENVTWTVIFKDDFNRTDTLPGDLGSTNWQYENTNSQMAWISNNTLVFGTNTTAIISASAFEYTNQFKTEFDFVHYETNSSISLIYTDLGYTQEVGLEIDFDFIDLNFASAVSDNDNSALVIQTNVSYHVILVQEGSNLNFYLTESNNSITNSTLMLSTVSFTNSQFTVYADGFSSAVDNFVVYKKD